MQTRPTRVSQGDQSAAYRILDANLNRALEGLRVVEEYLRFSLEDAYLASICKQIRHEVAQWASALPVKHLHRARDSARDVGTTIGTASEYQRPDLPAVAAANCKRVQQALRSIEEYAKVVAPATAAQIEPLRYRTYMLERATTITRSALEQLAQVRLYVLLDGRDSLSAFLTLARQLILGGADVLQLRDPRLSDRDLLQRARALRELTRHKHVLLIVNDRPDLALLADADGVHLGQDDLALPDARRILGVDRLIGVSTHNITQARQAIQDGADYLGCGPTFPSTTKSFDQFAGLEFLRQVSREIQIPAFAIGGIDAGNISRVCATGIRRVAVKHCLVDAAHPQRATRQLHQALHRAGGPDYCQLGRTSTE